MIFFVSVQVPAVFDTIFPPHLTNELLALTEYCLVFAGDMNAISDLMLDRSNVIFSKAQKQTSDMFNDYISALNLVDIWHVQNPKS